MATSINIKCNFTSIFAKYNTLNEIKELGNILCAQVKEAYMARAAEIKATQTPEVEVEVEVEIEEPKSASTKGRGKSAKTASAKTEKAAKTIKSAKTEKAQEAAETPKAKGVKVDKTKKGKKTKSAKEDEILLTDTAAIKKLNLTFEKYSEKSWVLRGDTKPICNQLIQKLHGRLNYHLKGGPGVIFSTPRAQEAAKVLNIKTKIA